MAKGFEKHRQRQDALGKLGRALARRSKSSCELCTRSGVELAAHEVPPIPEEPEEETCVFACGECRSDLAAEKIGDPRRWRVLENTVWSEVPAVQVIAVRLLRQLVAAKETWAEEVLEGLYLAPEVESWIDGDRPD